MSPRTPSHANLQHHEATCRRYRQTKNGSYDPGPSYSVFKPSPGRPIAYFAATKEDAATSRPTITYTAAGSTGTREQVPPAPEKTEEGRIFAPGSRTRWRSFDPHD